MIFSGLGSNTWDFATYVANLSSNHSSFMTTPPTSLNKGKIICPRCGDLAIRVKRTLGDRLVSLFRPIKRYRCDFCEWSAVLPVDGTKIR